MSKLNTKDIKIGGDGVSKTFEPGNIVAKINSIYLEEFKFKPGAYNIMLSLEGEDLGTDFEGFFYKKDYPELGRYKGKASIVKGTEWAFADGETKSGIAISRDTEILKFLKQLSVSLNSEWLTSVSGTFDTIEELFKGMEVDKAFQNEFFNFCVAGKEYTNKQGYTSYELFLPKYTRTDKPIALRNSESEKVCKFDPAIHIKRKKVENVNEFGSAPTENPFNTSTSISDFDLD
jgi:hypothetical protein